MRIDAAHCRRAPGAVPMRFPAPFRSDTLSSTVALSACPRRLNQGRQERLVTGPCAHTHTWTLLLVTLATLPCACVRLRCAGLCWSARLRRAGRARWRWRLACAVLCGADRRDGGPQRYDEKTIHRSRGVRRTVCVCDVLYCISAIV